MHAAGLSVGTLALYLRVDAEFFLLNRFSCDFRVFSEAALYKHSLPFSSAVSVRYCRPLNLSMVQIVCAFT